MKDLDAMLAGADAVLTVFPNIFEAFMTAYRDLPLESQIDEPVPAAGRKPTESRRTYARREKPWRWGSTEHVWWNAGEDGACVATGQGAAQWHLQWGPGGDHDRKCTAPQPRLEDRNWDLQLA